MPLPEEIMQSLPILPLVDGGQQRAEAGGAAKQRVPQRKKDKRKLRHERWLQSKELMMPYYFIPKIHTMALGLLK